MISDVISAIVGFIFVKSEIRKYEREKRIGCDTGKEKRHDNKESLLEWVDGI